MFDVLFTSFCTVSRKY